MRLNKLTLSGFKSFAKTTAFEFPSSSSAIVGPNGSGKSNIAEAIRWTLGEQSLKILRGKKGEDLIFNGSASSPRMGKAAVRLTFDNRDHSIPLDFDTVTMERKIFRDGTNEYYLNDSQVRLKDTVELLAKIGLGETKHNIIGQGEVDRILAFSPRERREMLEEAIGLRIWQLKKREAERKLEATAENVVQAAAIIRELSPHLKFLKSQSDKAERREKVERELEEVRRAYVFKERAAIARERENLAAESGPPKSRLRELERIIERAKREVEGVDGQISGGTRLAQQPKELEELEARRRGLERELGRIEGRMEGREEPGSRASVPPQEIEAGLRPIIAGLERTGAIADVAGLREGIRAAADRLERLISDFKRLPSGAPGRGADLGTERKRIQDELNEIDGHLKRLRSEIGRALQAARSAQHSLRERFEAFRASQEEASAIRMALERAEFEEEKLRTRGRELERLIADSGLSADITLGESPLDALPAEELKRKIERLKARLEEIGGIDQAMLKEYQDTKSRHDFLERERNDLAAAERDLRKLIAELDQRIERDFKDGFSKIRESFQNYFRIIFGGGRGILSYGRLKTVAEGDETEEPREAEYGVDVDVDLPRKRVKGLAMLSGGERALVSIALLFAITAVNPPPFLVLDETDAALDEANSQKYAAILKELSEKTQLILITHNRETMKQAGILYGVTMGQDGISKILSLKLEEAESYGNR